MYQKKKISLIIPCYNEAGGLSAMLPQVPDFIDEIIIIDNCSSDSTVAIATEFGARIIFLGKKNYGLSYRTSLPQAIGEILVLMDGDGSYPVMAIEPIINYMLADDLDFISGSRFPLKEKVSMPRFNKIGNLLVSWVIKKIFPINLNDSQSGMMTFKKSILPKIMPKSNGMSFSQEIKLGAWLDKKLKCAEYKIDYRKRIGRVKFRYFWDILAIINSLLFYKYNSNRKAL